MVSSYIRMVALGVASLIAVGAAGVAREDTAEAGKAGVLVSHSADRRPSRTAQDWVTYADHVVAVRAISEEPIKPRSDELEIGEGLILRKVTLRVDGVVWSRPNPSEVVPNSFTWVADGWQFTDGDLDNRTPMVDLDEPRIETGHSYLMAIDWQPARCSPGDFIPAQWRGLGDDSTIPFDDQVIGNGEMEGREQSPDEARSKTDRNNPNYSLEDSLAGEGTAQLSEALNAATPAEEKEYGPRTQTTCG